MNIKEKLWTAGQSLDINFELARFEGRARRPFVAVWIEDEKHKPVRRIAVWYNKPRWLPDLRSWFAAKRDVEFDAASVTGATRGAGQYTLVWDGKNDAGQYVNQGKYTVFVEAAREHGTYQLIKQEMNFDGKIGIWPFVKRVEATRKSANRDRGVLETKLLNVTKVLYEDFILNKIIPVIHASEVA